MKRGTPRTASRREEVRQLNPYNVVAQLLTSQPATVDLTVTFISHSDVMGPSRITREEPESSIVHDTRERDLWRIQLLHCSGADHPGLVVLKWLWLLLKEVELLRRQLEELNGRMGDIRQQSANAAMNAARCCEKDGTDGDETASGRHGSRETRAGRAWQRFRRLGLYV